MNNKNQKLVFIALILCVLVLLLLILEPVDRQRGNETYKERPVSSDVNGSNLDGGAGTKSYGETDIKMPDFNLKYNKYLISAPYTYDIDGEERTFQFAKMRAAITTAEQAESDCIKEEKSTSKGTMLTYIDNYKNRNGYAPYYHGGSSDLLGNSRSASAPGYYNKDNQEEFVYIADGTLVKVIEENDDYTKVAVVGDKVKGEDEETKASEGGGIVPIYYVPSKYVPTDDPITSLKKVIVVDRKNQNIAAFEKENHQWKIVSYSLATTGKDGKYHKITPLGYYYAVERRERFYYLKDGTNTIEGYAPYAVRFSAGAYIHGVSTSYRYTAAGKRIDPGIQEFSSSIGTVPLSHKCVRNYTSHAKFIYDWYEHGKTIVIVIE